MGSKINPALGKVVPEKFLNDNLYALDIKEALGGASIAYYNTGPKDGSANSTYYVGANNLDTFKKFELMSLTLHETNPGHHFDLTVVTRALNMPEFITAYGFGYHASAPAATPTYTAFTEGWALYAEYLGNEMGMYSDPHDLLGFYSWNLLRAVRLVVDTGLHAFDWTRQRAVDFMRDNTGLSEHSIQREVDRYITQPGQATAYKIGERAIRQLRAEKEAEQGEAFDLKRFHAHVLACKGPMQTLGKCVKMQEKMEEAETL